MRSRSLVVALTFFGLTTLASVVQAAPIVWTNWTAANATTASGTMGGVTVSFSGDLNPAAQVAGGTNFWAVNSGIYTSAPDVDNAPPDSDIIRLNGGAGTGTQTITFSQALTTPVMAIMSLGQPAVPVRWVFTDEDFTILNSGTGFFGGAAGGSLFEDAGEVLRGIEGHGVIRFNGTFTSITFTLPDLENWHGFQVGVDQQQVVQQQVVPEPATLLLVAGGFAARAVRRRARRSQSSK